MLNGTLRFLRMEGIVFNFLLFLNFFIFLTY